MTEVEWLACGDPMRMIQALPSSANVRKLALFALACCQADEDLMNDRHSRVGVEWSETILERYAVDDSQLPSEGDCYQMSAAANNCIYLADSVVRGEDCDAVEAALAAVTALADSYEAESLRGPRATLLRDIFGNPFRPVAFDPCWHTEAAVSLAEAIYAERAFDRLPILADALQDAGCEDADILAHCRGPVKTHDHAIGNRSTGRPSVAGGGRRPSGGSARLCRA